MDIKLEQGLKLVKEQPACIKTTLFVSGDDAFVIAKDERGQTFLFKPIKSPSVFIEVIRTFAGKVRGNHVHRNCTETLQVISGEVKLYLLCEHGNHVFKQSLKAGQGIITPQNTPHALYSVKDSECVVLFDRDPSDDRARIPIIRY